ncbi:MAG TPA: DUF1592 domain-containing protein [Methylomirabilota bacterium]|nr:DUF1592 domain-containing protein [Methylomirabilota bacterium]
MNRFTKLMPGSFTLRLRVAALSVALGFLSHTASAAENPAAAEFRRDILPILRDHCFDCHADGTKKGEVAFDEFKSDEELLKPELWHHVLKNVRAGLMPPQKKPKLAPESQEKLEQWIKLRAFGIDPANPDPGRVTVRRLNRVEYQNTIRDLMGVEFDAEVEFPPDDTGYGFDNIGDVLTVSPMLLEKYLDAARTIVNDAVPKVGKVAPEQTITGVQFRAEGDEPPRAGQGRGRGNREQFKNFSFYEPAKVSTKARVQAPGTYQVKLRLEVNGNFEYDPGKCLITFKADGRELLTQEFGWHDNKTFNFNLEQKWEGTEKELTLELKPLTPVEKKLWPLDMRLHEVVLRGPLEKEHWQEPKNYARFFPRQAPTDPASRKAFAVEVLGSFARKAFRRPVDTRTVERLATLAESVYQQEGKTFEEGVAHAMVAVLASPRFLFRLEEPAGDPTGHFAAVDEFSLASRLSHFLWSTMPDERLLSLAERGELRKNLNAEVSRMLADARSDQFINNFTGQWLQTRDVEGIAMNGRVILARDNGQEREMRRQMEEFRARFAAQAAARTNLVNQIAQAATNSAPATNATAAAGQRPRNRRFNFPDFELDGPLRSALQRETEMYFASIVREDKPVVEMIDSDYTFLNERLAKHYGLTNLNITGPELRKVTLPAGNPRGGVLTHGSALIVTSNPDRTSPVKRGLFVLENFLGAPAPPPPPDIPALEASEQDFKDHEPTLREALAMHRDKPLCSSCHARMDPIGLAFENFNALGMWREKERNQTIDAAGQLATGESFNSVSELKKILATAHKTKFYRCLTEKLLTYATGRGPEHYDVESIDKIVSRMEANGGRFSALLAGVIESAPFQKMRVQPTQTAAVHNQANGN